MSAWDPAQYLKFADYRTRPAMELLARVPLGAPARIVDLGCGTGSSTELLTRRWPEAVVRGVDHSAAMLVAARKAHPDWIWEESDITSWMPEEPLDLIFSNAALHWLADHESLLPRLLGQISRGGILAVQMPRNFKSPAHGLIRKIAADGPWRGLLASVGERNPTLEPAEYYAMLATHSRVLDIWETEYAQVMDSAAAIGEWMMGSTLRPFLQKLSEDLKHQFMDSYLAALEDAYPTQADGRVIFPFKRIFIIAQR